MFDLLRNESYFRETDDRHRLAVALDDKAPRCADVRRLNWRPFPFRWLLRLIDVRYWHLADNPTVPPFVRYWSNSGQASMSGGLDQLGRE
jgi:hypothetical protein